MNAAEVSASAVVLKIHYKIEEMEADHIKPWSDGGKLSLTMDKCFVNITTA